MTRARQAQKARTGLFAGAIGVILATAQPLLAGEPVASDPQSGLAINGFDPVAYFADSAAKEGRPGIELSRDGSIWRFRNEGNRAAFADNPEVYSPRFGGYDPVAITRGTSVPGHPAFWLVFNERLYLFYDVKARAVFAAEPERVMAAAERKWPAVQKRCRSYGAIEPARRGSPHARKAGTLNFFSQPP